ncbi:MAG: 3-dehydroquinate synthase [Candidatus Symbiothrix sp.]|jgi:3-dehydroquinate synthase|nr:3-dehydroquinate synthase [Candidatus Symbiothrix sp.]
MAQQIVRCKHIESELSQFLKQFNCDGIFILTDENTDKFCFPHIQPVPELQHAKKIVIPAGDENKTIATISSVWQFLTENGASRKSLLINLGGGMITDLGGFAAASFKRGISFINIPTTLLGAVDAAVGGKTGINFNGLKNEIGAFAPAVAVFIDASFFRTLDLANLLSGFAEMLKHGLLTLSLRAEQGESPQFPAIIRGSRVKHGMTELLGFDFDNVDYGKLNDLLFESVLVKERIVLEDPTEQGIRKALNLGHTFGHAFESLSYQRKQPVLHGYAVAYGLVCELYLSYLHLNFDKKLLLQVAHFVKENYGKFDFDCNDYPQLIELMQHDKKNENGKVNFTLMKSVGVVKIDQTATEVEMYEAFDFLREY